MSVRSKEKMLIVRERKCVRRRTGMNADWLHSSVIDAVQRNRVRPEVRDPQRAVVATDDSAHRPVANGVRSTYLVGRSRYLRDAVGAEVRNEDLAAVRLHRKMNGHLAHIKQRKHLVGQERGILLRRPRARRCCKTDGHHLMTGGAGDKGL